MRRCSFAFVLLAACTPPDEGSASVPEPDPAATGPISADGSSTGVEEDEDEATTTGIGDDGSPSDLPNGTTGVEPGDGSLRVLTYNVAGLPELISGSNPSVNTPLISPLLNAYDLVLVQEDFSYHAELSADATHPHQSEPGGTGSLGDGLNRFSNHPFDGFERHAWEQCNGLIDAANDCLTDKGFSAATHELDSGALVDVYNLHMDAGGSVGDKAARRAQIEQMLARIAQTPDRALIVAGDTNLGASDEADVQTLLIGAGLSDACRELGCGDDARIDRVMFRSSAAVTLTPTDWLLDPAFVDGSGAPLSDHLPVAVDFAWTSVAPD